MIKILVFFALLTAAFFFVITQWRLLTNQKKWQLVKALAFSAMCAVFAMVVLAAIVLLF